ncbi:unnamed protein product, partial [Choristocarpus tenellus]
RHFTVEFLVGENVSKLKEDHIALQTDELIPEDIMRHVYGKDRNHQV